MSARGIRHEAFFATLGKTPEESELWAPFLAALVTLRLIDEWLTARHVPVEMLAAVHTTLDTVAAHDPSRHLVADLLVPITRRDPPDFRSVAKPLFAYARWLHKNSHWALADDVYTTVWHGLIDHPPASKSDIDLASKAALFAGACRRGIGDAAAADEAYAEAHTLAMQLNNEVRARKAELGRAKVVRQRGNLPAAEAALRELIAQTTHPSLADVRAEAFHELGVTLFWRDEHDAAIEAYHEAWISTIDPEERLRVVVDIAGVLGELEYVEQARTANLLVRERSTDVTLQGIAGVNLIELARQDRDEAEFARYRELVAQDLERLPTKIQVDYHYCVGLGYETFGDSERALERYDLAIEIAESHGLGQELYRIDCARDAIVDGLSNVTPPLAPTPLPSVVRVGRALADARVAAH
jgi:tetratricopeptide (TPR) repeat protein